LRWKNDIFVVDRLTPKMLKTLNTILLVGVLTGIVLFSYADRGYNRKSKSKVSLNISTSKGFKNQLNSNLSSGLKYSGSFTSTAKAGNPYASNSLITFQKGNSVYIFPAYQKIFFNTALPSDNSTKILIKSQG